MVCIRSQCTYHFLPFWKGLDHIFFTAILTYLLTITWLVACINNLLMIIPSWSDGLMTIIIKCNSPFLNSDGVIMSWEAVQMNYLWHLQLRLFCVCVCVCQHVYESLSCGRSPESLWGNKSFRFKCSSYDGDSQDDTGESALHLHTQPLCTCCSEHHVSVRPRFNGKHAESV